jgi:hypothetical protein|tara:strand:- start:5193 stop:5786 length:594 start_codon:yes stop_codon:yes gene_type:complete
MINLTGYTSVHTSLFVRIQVDQYRTTSTGTYAPEVLTFTDHFADYTISSELYQNVGDLLNITASRSQIRNSSDTVSISLSGIPNTNLAEIIHSRIKGSPVRIYRGFFDNTNTLIGTVQGRFRGFVNNYSLQEDYDIDGRTATNTIALECSTTIDVLNNKYSGRRTNPDNEKKYFPADLSFERVPNLADLSFNFGVPK